MTEYKVNLQMFNGDAGAGAAPATGDAGAADIQPGVLEDGTQVDSRLAARMRKQEERRKARGQSPLYNQKPGKAEVDNGAKEAQQPAEEKPAEEVEDREARWNSLKKGDMKDLWGRDIQAAISDRFKNQADANDRLNKLTPALNILAKQRGIEEGDFDALSESILNDDSMIEDEADAAGMTVSAYRTMQQIKQQNEEYQRREAQSLEEQRFQAHIQKLVQQGEELKKQFPDFDLRTELANDAFRRMTSPEGGLSVEDAYYAIHHRELAPQAMAYGIQRAKEQISKTLQSNQRRPTEGAVTGGQAANFQIDPKSLSRKEREELIRRARLGEKIEF